jgi:tetratricopeptide (TPR) repeat protein
MLAGEHSQAVTYIEQALVSDSSQQDSTSSTATTSYAVFHNNLGECYRYLGSPPPPPLPAFVPPSVHSTRCPSPGRFDEAEEEFGKALAIDPNLHSAEYNLGESWL